VSDEGDPYLNDRTIYMATEAAEAEGAITLVDKKIMTKTTLTKPEKPGQEEEDEYYDEEEDEEEVKRGDEGQQGHDV